MKTQPGIGLYLEKILIVIVVVIISSIFILQWKNCLLDSNFFFSPLDLKLRIIFDIRSNQSALPFIAKLFHNKAVQGSVDIFNSYIHFWDIRFLLFLLSPLTLFGVVLRVFYHIKEHIRFHRFEIALLSLAFLTPLILLFHLPVAQFISLLVFSLPLIIFSALGIFIFSKRQQYWLIYVLVVAGVSLYFLFGLHLLIVEFCHV